MVAGGRYRSLLLALVLIAVGFVNCEVIAVFEFARHGARGPLVDIMGNTGWLKTWGAEQLTGNGMRMHYHLGSEIKYRYPDIFNQNFKVSQMEAISTNFNRTISSGLSHFFGLFDMYKGEELPFPNNDPRLQPPKLTIDPEVGFKTALPKGFTPIPITSKLNQRILMPIRDDCPYGKKIALDTKATINELVMKSPKVTELLQTGASKYGIKNVADLSQLANGQSTPDIESLFVLGDYAIEDDIHNPDAVVTKHLKNKDLYKQLENAYSVATIARFNDSTYRKNIVSEFLLEILNRTKEIISKENYDMKYFFYSGHDDILSALLLSTNVISADCMISDLVSGNTTLGCDGSPSLASNVVFELHREKDADKRKESSYSVKVRYNTKFIDFCVKLNDGEEFVCKYDEFERKITELTNSRYMDWCVNGEDDESFEAEVAIWKFVTLGMIALFFSLLIGCVITTHKIKRLMRQQAIKTSEVGSLDDVNGTLVDHSEYDPRV